jgi:hypothetical protein
MPPFQLIVRVLQHVPDTRRPLAFLGARPPLLPHQPHRRGLGHLRRQLDVGLQLRFREISQLQVSHLLTGQL